MKQPIIGLDVDGTIITQDDPFNELPIQKNIDLALSLHNLGCKVYLWSGSGVIWANHWAEMLNLPFEVIEKGSIKVDIAIDDLTDQYLRSQEGKFGSLGTVNIYV